MPTVVESNAPPLENFNKKGEAVRVVKEKGGEEGREEGEDHVHTGL